jgi:hypothetical protein
MGRGSTDKQTIKLQNYLRKLESTDKERYDTLEELLALRGYIVYHNKNDVLMVRKPGDIDSLSTGEITAIVNGIHPSHYMKGE